MWARLTACVCSLHSLWDNDIGDEGCAALSEGLKGNTSLTTLEYVLCLVYEGCVVMHVVMLFDGLGARLCLLMAMMMVRGSVTVLL